MVTIEGLLPNTALSEPIELIVTDVDWSVPSRRAEVTLEDMDGTPVRFVDYTGADLSVDWTPSGRYRIAGCRVHSDGTEGGVYLAGTKRTEITPVDSEEDPVQLLIVGDTHIGRTIHPGTGVDIDPIAAFASAAEFAIEQQVDAVVHVGDIFHESVTAGQAGFTLIDVLQPLAEAEIPFYYIEGNHSGELGQRILAGDDAQSAVHLDSSGVSVGSSVRVYGVDHIPGESFQSAGIQFGTPDPDEVSILVLHQTLEQLSGASAKSIDLHDLQAAFGGPFDAVVCGHHHDAKHETWLGKPLLYTGASEHMSTNENASDRVAWLLTVRAESVSVERYDIP